ncbi:MAG: hypothetical protein IJX03_07085, partial [Clostridia bacterium]|nr:hypothetical protein [Clostridia bacterium]
KTYLRDIICNRTFPSSADTEAADLQVGVREIGTQAFSKTFSPLINKILKVADIISANFLLKIVLCCVNML